MSNLLKDLGRLALVCLALVSFSGMAAFAWTNAEGEEDWGETCYLEQSHESGIVLILTGKGSFGPALLISNYSYPENGGRFSVNFNIADGSRFERSGMVDDYFGQIYVELDRRSFDGLSAGSSVTIEYPGAVVSVPLGRPDAFSDFLRCAGEVVSGSSSEPASKPKGGFWKSR